MNRRSLLTLVALTVCSTACGTTRSYKMPLTSAQVPQAVDPLLVCATKMNLQAKQKGQDVVVLVADGTRLVYKASDSGSLVMEAHVDGSEDDPTTARKLTDAKATGDALFNCAQAVPTPASKSPGQPTPTLGNTTTAP